MHTRCLLATLACALCCPAAPLATFAVGEAQFALDDSGSFRLTSGDRVWIDGASVVIAAPGWQRTVGTRHFRSAEGYPRKDEGAAVLKGTIVDEKDGIDWALTVRVAPEGKSVRLVYELTPDRDAQISEAPVFLNLPLATWSGRTVVLFPSVTGQFPVEKPSSRHFLSGMARRAVFDVGGRPLGIRFAALTQCTVQDAGTGDGRHYQIYPRIARGPLVKGGQTQQLEMLLTPDDPAPVEMPVVPLADDRVPGITGVRLSQQETPCFEKLEIAANVQGTWTNPYDPEQVAFDARITDPDGREVLVPGFFMQDYTPMEGNTGELERQGTPRWLVRFAPTRIGPHRAVLELRNQDRTIASEPVAFAALPARDARGFLRVSRANPRYLQFDDGTPFFALGENIAVMGGDLAPSITLHEKLAAVGGNFVRWWICRGGIDLESLTPLGPDQGLGRIRQPDAWRLDRMVETAERLGIRAMVCIETQQSLRRDKNWGQFTYNQAVGGPAATPADFFTDPEAARLFRRRLRYISARWGYSTAVFSWQFWNEVSACNDFVPENSGTWHRDMAAYLRGIDPNRHVIHTNFGNLDGNRLTDGLPGIEVVSTNSYSRRDMGYTAWWGARRMTQEYAKPFLLTEYGVGHYGGWMGEDPTGIIVHNGLWGATMGGAAGAGLPWGWDHWVNVGDFYHYWRPLADFVLDVPFCQRDWRPVTVSSFLDGAGRERETWGCAFVEGWPRNYSFNLEPREPAEVYRVLPSGQVEPQTSLRGFLGSKQSQTFATDWQRPGVFRVHVPEITGNGDPKLEIALDGKVLLSRILPKDENTVHWRYWRQWEIPVPAGEHSIRVANVGTGTLWTAYELVDYRRRLGPDLDVFGLTCTDHILLWLRHPQFIWLCQKQGTTPPGQAPGQLTLQGIQPGNWQGSWIDTITGKNIGIVRATAQAGHLVIPTPAVANSAALKLRRDGAGVD